MGAMVIATIVYLEDLRVSQNAGDAKTKAAIVKVLNAVQISSEAKRVLDQGWLELDQSGQVRLEGQINSMLAALDAQSSATTALSTSLSGVIRDQAILLQSIYQMHLEIGRHQGRHECVDDE